MAIQLDATSNSTAGSSGTFNWSHTCAGGNRILVVFIAQKSTSQKTVSTLTYNGVAMHQWYEDNDGGAQVGVAAYYLVAPATGAHSISVVMSGNATNLFQGFAISLKGVDQASITTGTATGHIVGGLSNTVSESITTDVANAWIVTGVLKGSSGTPSPGALNAGMTTRTAFGSSANFNISTLTQTAAQAETLGWDNTNIGSDFWAQATVGFIPVQVLAAQASYTLTREPALITGARRFVATQASYVLTKFPNLIYRITTLANAALHSGTLSNTALHSASLTNTAQNTSSLTNQARD